MYGLESAKLRRPYVVVVDVLRAHFERGVDVSRSRRVHHKLVSVEQALIYPAEDIAVMALCQLIQRSPYPSSRPSWPMSFVR